MRYETLPALLSAIAACAKTLGDDATLHRASEMNLSLAMGSNPFGFGDTVFG